MTRTLPGLSAPLVTGIRSHHELQPELPQRSAHAALNPRRKGKTELSDGPRWRLTICGAIVQDTADERVVPRYANVRGRVRSALKIGQAEIAHERAREERSSAWLAQLQKP